MTGVSVSRLRALMRQGRGEKKVRLNEGGKKKGTLEFPKSMAAEARRPNTRVQTSYGEHLRGGVSLSQDEEKGKKTPQSD